jgi:hypothetical protein
MSVDVSKAAVDARVAKRDGARADLRAALVDLPTILSALLIVGAMIVGLRLYWGGWMPLGWNIFFVVVALGFAGGRMAKQEKH